MILKGWSKPICDEAAEAIKNGSLTVYWDKKAEQELLKGSYVNRYGIVVEFK